MFLSFNDLLSLASIPLEDVLLVRHQIGRSERSLFEVWRYDRPAFDEYQSAQTIANRKRFGSRRYWASFIAQAGTTAVFVGLYEVMSYALLTEDRPQWGGAGLDRAGQTDWYTLESRPELSEFVGRLHVDWGGGTRAWIQKAAQQAKPVLEIRKSIEDPPFPGFLEFESRLSQLESVPETWKAVLKHAKGVYLLTCPRTGECYVGQADGEGGFWQRWQDYVRNNHGGNVRLKSRHPSDYAIAILEVARSSCSSDELHRLEQRWMQKLQSRALGLNA